MSISKKSLGIMRGCLAVFILVLTTILGSIPILFMGLLKLFPNQWLKIYCTKIVDKVATLWCDVNNIYLDKAKSVQWEITGLNDFNPQHWYLVVANHQSWLDVVVLQRLFNRKIPVLKFFIKDQLKWIPFLGFSWWAMGCPFMKRYSPAYLAKNPHKKGKDIQATQKALTLFKKTPGSLMSFIEGTRYTPQKKLDQSSPYQHLLKPKAGGIGFVISAMDKQINRLLDVTIIYPRQHNSLWDFLCHRMGSIKIHIRQLPIPQQFLCPSLLEEGTRQSEFRQWLNQQWSEKDELMRMMKGTN